MCMLLMGMAACRPRPSSDGRSSLLLIAAHPLRLRLEVLLMLVPCAVRCAASGSAHLRQMAAAFRQTAAAPLLLVGLVVVLGQWQHPQAPVVNRSRSQARSLGRLQGCCLLASQLCCSQ